jgi:hypothetical protein
VWESLAVTVIISVLRDVYDILYEPSYRVMGDNLGGGEQRERVTD